MDRLGPMVLSWRRVINGTSNYIATGKLVMLDNPRFTVLTSTTSSTLLITLAAREDAGQYLCEISSNPPVHMTHWLRIKGRSAAQLDWSIPGNVKKKEKSCNFCY